MIPPALAGGERPESVIRVIVSLSVTVPVMYMYRTGLFGHEPGKFRIFTVCM